VCVFVWVHVCLGESVPVRYVSMWVIIIVVNRLLDSNKNDLLTNLFVCQNNLFLKTKSGFCHCCVIQKG
jgi:hypothetical protein